MNNTLSKFRIVADSAADITALDSVPFAAAPLKIIAGDREFIDTDGLNVVEMVDYLKSHKGKSTSSCPNPDEWLAAFGDAQYILGVTLSGNISGSCNAAQIAKEIYEAEHPERHVFIIDSLSAGTGEALLVEKLEELVQSGMPYRDICNEIKKYQRKTGLLFMLESLTNFANNGRVNPAVAKIVGLLGINIVGKASNAGTLEPINKCRGLKKALDAIVGHLRGEGFTHGKIRISHCFNEGGALELKQKLIEVFGHADIKISETKGLCSYYAERGGILVGYEL